MGFEDKFDELNNKRLSQIIDFLRFPLAVMIVMAHADFEEITIGGVDYVFELNSYPLFLNVSHLISRIIVRFAVPLYFMFSGFLFFNNMTQYSIEDYRNKIIKRTQSLFPPYLFWNFEVVMFFYLAQTAIPNMTSGANILIRDYTITDWLLALWTPICGPFWYIRDLFILILVTPVLYFLIKKNYPLLIGVLGTLWVIGYRHEPVGCSTTSLFFFSLGAVFPIKRYDLLKFTRNIKNWTNTLSLIYITLLMILYNFREVFMMPTVLFTSFYNIGLLFLVFAVVSISDVLLQRDKGKINAFLKSSSFFIYGFHALPLLFFTKLFVKSLWPLSDANALIVYILSPIVTITIGLLSFFVLKKLFPGFTSLITGNRAT